jgi:hypothetical protein
VLKLSQPRRPARMPTEPHPRPRRPSGSLSRKRNGPIRTESLILALFRNLIIECHSCPCGVTARRCLDSASGSYFVTAFPRQRKSFCASALGFRVPMTRGEFTEFVRVAGMGVAATADARPGSFRVVEGSWVD